MMEITFSLYTILNYHLMSTFYITEEKKEEKKEESEEESDDDMGFGEFDLSGWEKTNKPVHLVYRDKRLPLNNFTLHIL